MKSYLKKGILILIILTLVTLSSLFAGRIEEFEYLKTTIEKSHKNFFNTIDKEECDEVYKALSKDIEAMSYSEYYFTLSSYLALSNDSHTSLEAYDIYSYFLYFPLQLNYIGDKVYVVSGLKDYSSYMGKEVSAINGITIKEIEERGSKVVPHDNTVYLRLWLNNQLNNTSFLSFIGVAESEESDVSLSFSDGSVLPIKSGLSSAIDRNNLISAISSYSPYI